MFIPSDENCSIPNKNFDVMRRTYTDLETKAENIIKDFWTQDSAMELSSPWKGKTVFYVLHSPAPPGNRWVEGRINKVQQTSRPDSVWPEIRQIVSKE